MSIMIFVPRLSPFQMAMSASAWTTITTEIRDLEALRLGCCRLRIPEPVLGTAQLFSSEKTGYAVQLDCWRYPVIIDLQKREVHFDSFTGHWGSPDRLNEFRQAYAAEKTRMNLDRLFENYMTKAWLSRLP